MFSAVIIIQIPIDNKQISNHLYNFCEKILKCVDYVSLVSYEYLSEEAMRILEEKDIHFIDVEYFDPNCSSNCIYINDVKTLIGD